MAVHLNEEKNQLSDTAQMFGVSQACYEKLAEKANVNEIVKDG